MDSEFAHPSETPIDQIRRLDDLLLAAVSGQEREVGAWVEDRRKAVQQYVRQNPTIPELEEIQDRTRRLEDRFLHWRRSSMMELSMLERHVRYVNEQHPSAERPIHVRINISA